MKKLDKLDNMALLVSQIVLAAFAGVLLFSEIEHALYGYACDVLRLYRRAYQRALTIWGMNALLEHWAMAIHPPTLFVGYAGLTIPFAYAIAALIVNDSSKAWVGAQLPLRPVLVAVPGHRHRPGSRVGLRGARLGRLLGLGSGRERELALVARGRRASSTASRCTASAARSSAGA